MNSAAAWADWPSGSPDDRGALLAEYPPMSVIFPASPAVVTSRPPLIGVAGRARSGKDTFAARLVDVHGFTRYGFADLLKEAALRVDPFIPDPAATLQPAPLSTVIAAYGWERAKEDVPEVRRLLQDLGVGMRDTFGPDVWVRHVVSQIDHDGLPAVIPDVRFPNEARAVLSRGGVLVRIIRPNTTNTDQHVSETALAGVRVHHEIVNDATIAELHAHADRIVA